ncbi:cobalamin biosynthesis protein CobG [Tomitella cavernea]
MSVNHAVRAPAGLCHYVPVPPPPPRSCAADRCPGLLRPHHADDGALVRLRVPGGVLTSAMFAALRSVSDEFGDGRIHLTSRANAQLRSLPTGMDSHLPGRLFEVLRTAGFLPSPSHERVRNIVCSPLSGIAGGRADVRGLAGALDRALCAAPELADLPGRFLFGIDDGRGDVAKMGCDVLALAEAPGCARIIVGDLAGPAVPLHAAPGALVALARRFAAAADGHWRARELPLRGGELLDGPVTATLPDTPAPTMVYGALPGGALSVLAPMGVLTPEHGDALAAAAGTDGTLIITPWRGVVVVPQPAPPRGALARLAGTGLVTTNDSPWTRITACIGAPGCAKSAGDTHAAARAAASGPGPPGHVHVVGCSRACGAPHSPHTLLELGSKR